jgi:hypothetical protein
MSCPDWRGLADLRDRHDAPGWDAAVAHFESGCPSCRRAALTAEPTLVFRRLRSDGAPGALEMSPAQEASEVEAVRRAVAAMRTARRADRVASGSRRLVRARRWAVAAGLALAALSIPADNAWQHQHSRGMQARQPSLLPGAVVPAALVGGEGVLPTVDGVNRPGARVYHMDGEGMSVVMIVDESLDV